MNENKWVVTLLGEFSNIEIEAEICSVAKDESLEFFNISGGRRLKAIIAPGVWLMVERKPEPENRGLIISANEE